MVQKLSVRNLHPDFKLWLVQIKEIGCTYEIVIEDGYITRIYIREGDNGDWSNIEHGRVFGSKMLSFKQRVFMPRVINGNFIADYNDD